MIAPSWHSIVKTADAESVELIQKRARVWPGGVKTRALVAVIPSGIETSLTSSSCCPFEPEFQRNDVVEDDDVLPGGHTVTLWRIIDPQIDVRLEVVVAILPIIDNRSFTVIVAEPENKLAE
jgi:hypothetical protein